MFSCASKFEVEEEQNTLLKDFFSRDELETAREEEDDRTNEIDIDPISDNEEECSQEEGWEADGGNDLEGALSPGPPTLPEVENTQMRASGRARKRTRYEDDQYLYH